MYIYPMLYKFGIIEVPEEEARKMEIKRLNRFLDIFHIIETIKVGLVDHVSCLRAMSINQK